MLQATAAARVVCLIVICWCTAPRGAESAIGVNWGILSFHKLKPSIVVHLLKDNKISKVKLFDADPDCIQALMGSGIQVMLGIPNEMLPLFSSSTDASDLWVRRNVSRYVVKNGVDIRYIAVGNEPFLSSYSGQFQSYVMPALLNLQQSLAKVNLASYVKLVVPFNIYPFLSLYGSSDFPQEYAFFEGTSHSVTDGSNVYNNAFDGNFDTLVAALGKLGYGQMPIVIGEVGWPTDGAISANLTAAKTFNQGLIKHVLSNKGTPLRPGVPPVDVYLFGLLDEGAKSTLPGTFERHWGIFSFDGQAKYPLNLGLGSKRLINARNVEYLPSRWSQMQNERSCDFDGIGMVTFLDPSMGDCRFLVGVTDTSSSSSCVSQLHQRSLILWIWIFISWRVWIFVT
ncbi:hypothetical protein M0R45_012706 [Rubus argutus]|uniref:glucan endo-1,3-beta-D-glucosidase n=1 Tax=Rubus argutus TaxID=59490 RepID=A0AAW1XHD1_RUBAR